MSLSARPTAPFAVPCLCRCCCLCVHFLSAVQAGGRLCCAGWFHSSGQASHPLCCCGSCSCAHLCGLATVAELRVSRRKVSCCRWSRDDDGSSLRPSDVGGRGAAGTCRDLPTTPWVLLALAASLHHAHTQGHYSPGSRNSRRPQHTPPKTCTASLPKPRPCAGRWARPRHTP